ncbi:MAG: hypothetical protein NC410_11600 [Oscillibacter sp.]|nr:hypothetical protein [Oscillibacter sp.]
MYRILIFFTIIILCHSCRPNDISYYQKIIDANTIDIDSIETLVIIPGVGCLGCITGAERFLKLHSNKKNIKFILTNIQSIKTLRLKLGHAIDSSSIYLDKKNLWFDTENENSIYPTVILVKNKKIISLEYISPHNPNSIQSILKNGKCQEDCFSYFSTE